MACLGAFSGSQQGLGIGDGDKRLRYDAAANRVFYRPIKRRPGGPDVFHWTPLAFIKEARAHHRAAAP